MTRRRYDYIPTVHERENNPDCKGCHVESEVNEQRIWCPNAAAEGRWCQMKKTYTNVQIGKPWPEHFNIAAGRVIRTEHQLKEHYKAKSDEMSERMNFDVNYQIADASDTKTLKVTEKGLDSTHDAKVASGEKESKGKFVF